MEKDLSQLKKPRITQDEQHYFKTIFENRDDLILLVRDLFFGFTLTEAEKNTLKALFLSPELKRLMRKLIVPELERGVPLLESIDMWMMVELGIDEKQNKLNIETHKKYIEMVETALNLLDDPFGSVVDLSSKDLKTVNLIARGVFVKVIEKRLFEIVIMANRQDESIEEQLVKQAKNSAK